MSRTHHHGKRNVRKKFAMWFRTSRWSTFGVDVEPTPPKRRRHNREWDPMNTTPSAWTRLVMNRPQRRACRLLEQRAKTRDLEGWEFPHGRKPQVYYW